MNGCFKLEEHASLESEESVLASGAKKSSKRTAAQGGPNLVAVAKEWFQRQEMQEPTFWKELEARTTEIFSALIKKTSLESFFWAGVVTARNATD